MDGRSPLIVGIGQLTNRRERIADPMSLMEESARAADADAGGRALTQVDAVQVVGFISWSYSDPSASLSHLEEAQEGESFDAWPGAETDGVAHE